MKVGLIIVVVVIVFISTMFYFVNKISFDKNSINKESDKKILNDNNTDFSNPERTPHYENSFPAHQDILAILPYDVVINFNFDLDEISEISIMNNDNEYGDGETKIENELTLRRAMDQTAPDGLYTVKYKACWPDKSCHNGKFQFIVDKTLKESFVDMRNQNIIEIKMSDISFKPEKILVSKGTTITWINDELPVHYVNTDPHAGHNYFHELNSRALKQGDNYTLRFEKQGIYPYHCSAHASYMKGVVLVE